MNTTERKAPHGTGIPNTGLPDHDEWINQATDQLRRSEDSVDYVVESKLSAARARAIAKAPQNPYRQRLNLAASAVAGIAVFYLAVRVFQPGFSWTDDNTIVAATDNNMQLITTMAAAVVLSGMEKH